MRSIAVAALGATILLAVTGCANASPSAPNVPVPAGVQVQTQLAALPSPAPGAPVVAIGTVIEQEDGDLLCVGMVQDSAPPQCRGLALISWDWEAFDHEETGGKRWVESVALEGIYDPDAQSFTRTGEPMNAAAITMPAVEVPAGTLDDATIEAVEADFFALERADVLYTRGEQGTVVVAAAYDDGTVQAAIDEIYGSGVVFVISALRGELESALIDPPMDTAAPVITGDARTDLATLPRPSATEPVLAMGTVLEASTGPDAGIAMLCRDMAASYPPQCGGPEVVGWDWSTVEHEEASGVRWTESAPVAMRVTYDSARHAMTPVEMLDPASIDFAAAGTASAGTLDDAAIQQLQQDLLELARPDIMSFGGGDGRFEVGVVYDDGSIQAAFDEIYGPHAVHVTSWLMP